ncbi:ABC transporter permease [Herpetosiphon geysericola]|uniref:Transport permease protein n=1 Tax=Herpetosiphon geysericola TaxID=70996 RepID=A0A0P6YKL3_9CHLR|nr:ABC transporter permease [Herpetosiphon geysericola]KPL90319.1 phosphate ABC transporter permease [Herpetosiphon geysericola]
MQRASTTLQTTPITRIEASNGWVSLQLRELWAYRELLFFLIWRDVKVRYKQTVLGAAWAIIQPVFSMIVFTLIFGRLAKLPSDGIAYEAFSITALVPWALFANALSQGSNSLVGNANLIKKVYFPRLTVPISTVLGGLVDFAIAFVVMFGMLLWFDITPTMRMLALPLFILLVIITGLGVSLWLSALNVQFRDIRYVIPFMAQLWQYGSPVAYSSSLIPNQWRWLYGLNPMAGVIDGFRWSLLGTGQITWSAMLPSVGIALFLLITGALYFRRVEKQFADMV